MNHYPRHVGDIISATIGLSLMERGAYTALLDQYYAREAPLPLDRKEVYRLAAANNAAERKAVDYVVGRYFTQEADGWHQSRCDEEIAKYHGRSESAKRSINVRWSKRNTNVSETNVERNSNQEPVTSNHKPVEPKPKSVAPAALPDWLRPEDWERWKQHRRQKITPQAAILQIRKLEALRAAGHDPTALIDEAIERGWATFYPPKNHSPPSRTPTIAERRTATLDAITGKTHARDITSTASRVDSPPIRPLPVGLREQDRDDVGIGGTGGPVAGVG